MFFCFHDVHVTVVLVIYRWSTALKMTAPLVITTMSADKDRSDMIGFRMYKKLVCLVDDARSTTSTLPTSGGSPRGGGSGRSRSDPAMDKWASPFNDPSIVPAVEPDLGSDKSTVQSRIPEFNPLPR